MDEQDASLLISRDCGVLRKVSDVTTELVVLVQQLHNKGGHPTVEGSEGEVVEFVGQGAS